MIKRGSLSDWVQMYMLKIELNDQSLFYLWDFEVGYLQVDVHWIETEIM